MALNTVSRRLAGAAAVALLAVAVPAAAHRITGVVTCDTNFNGIRDDGDTPRPGIEIRAVSQTAEPGATYATRSRATAAIPGWYEIVLPVRSDSFVVSLNPDTWSPGSRVALPRSGDYRVDIMTGSTLTDHVENVDFLLECGPRPECLTDGECDDADPCTDDRCAAGTCRHEPNAAACDDGSACTIDDVCRDGACGGTPLVCADADHCTTDACDPAAGCTFDEEVEGTRPWVLCTIRNLRDGLAARPVCGKKCLRRLARRLARLEARIEQSAGLASPAQCLRRLRAVARKASAIERQVVKALRAIGGGESLALDGEARRLRARAKVLATRGCGGA